MKKTFFARFVTLLRAAAMCISLCACAGNTASSEADASASGEKIKIKLSTSWGENSSVQEGALKFGELLSEASNGRFEVTVYPSNQLASGNQQTAVEMVQNGDIEAALFGMTVLSFLDDRLAVVNMPFLIPSYEDADKLLFDETAESRILLDDLLLTNGMQSLAFGEAGYRQITNNKHEVRTPDDMKGLKFRVLSTCPMFFDLYETLGANPTAINMSEVFTSLQQGVVDGQENAVDTARSYKLNEVQSYITCWNGVYDAVAFVGSPKFWDGLSAEDQQLVKDCAKQAMDFQRETARASEEAILGEFEETMTITKLNDEEIQAFKDAVQPVYDKWYDAIGADVMAAFGYTK
jgi:tripartite ATP-independent transporter DctP family solute receptor